MSLDNLKERLRLLKSALSNPQIQKRVSISAAFASIGEYKRRIFVNGLSSDLSQIGTYSETPFYQNPNNLLGVSVSGITPLGKNGLDSFRSGKKKKTRYLGGGYKELRELTGRQSDFIDLNFSGSTQGAIQVGEQGEEAVIGFVDEKSFLIMQGHEERYGKEIISFSEEERDFAIKAARNEFLAIIQEI